MLASFFYVAAEDILTSEDKKVFSIWANLPTSYWETNIKGLLQLQSYIS